MLPPPAAVRGKNCFMFLFLIPTPSFMDLMRWKIGLCDWINMSYRILCSRRHKNLGPLRISTYEYALNISVGLFCRQMNEIEMLLISILSTLISIRCFNASLGDGWVYRIYSTAPNRRDFSVHSKKSLTDYTCTWFDTLWEMWIWQNRWNLCSYTLSLCKTLWDVQRKAEGIS